MPIFEPGLDTLVERKVNAGRLDFTLEIAGVLLEPDDVFIAVGTPSRRGDGHADKDLRLCRSERDSAVASPRCGGG